MDIEVYNAANQKMGQQYFVAQSLAPGQSMTNSILWAAPAAGTYRVKVGVFGANWAPLIMWNDEAADFSVSAADSGGPLATATAIPASSTPVPPTSTSVPATSTPVPPTSTTAAATNTLTRPTNTPVKQISTPVSPTATPTGHGTPSPSGCGLSQAAFCDTFDAPAGTGNRSGQLNGTVWGVSRIIGSGGPNGDNYASGTNMGQGWLDNFAPVTLAGCGNPTVLPDQDVQVCNGKLVEGVNDDGGQTVLAMYPKQPFDIAGRTGLVNFDVTADSQGPHGAWPAFAYTDQPVPAPIGPNEGSPLPGVQTTARNGFGFTFGALPTDCTGAPYCVATTKTGVDSVYAISNYVVRTLDFTEVQNTLTHAPGVLNHFQVRISTSRVEIWGTNAGSTTLQELGYVANPALSLTRGLVWMEDVHYNANKFNTQQSHTFIWDNVGFDGPVLPRDLTFDVPENGVHNGGAEQLGWGNATLTIPGVVNTARAVGALITLNWAPETLDTITLQVNGNPAILQPWVFNDVAYVWRTIAIPVPLSEVHEGANTVTISTSGGAVIANVDLILVGAGG